MTGPDVDFWQARFRAGNTPWDRGAASPQLQRWLEGGVLAPATHPHIGVPGCGSGHEVVALAQAGFDVVGIDYAAAAVDRTCSQLVASGLAAKVVQADVLAWSPDVPFDAVYEQTCLCALHPDRWQAYAAQLQRWLRPGGLLCALWMQALRPGAAEGRIEGPPYHCDIHAVRALFPASQWDWQVPPYERVTHPIGFAELAVTLVRR